MGNLVSPVREYYCRTLECFLETSTTVKLHIISFQDVMY